MKIAVSPANGRTVPSASAALSRRRRDVVPTQTMRAAYAHAVASGYRFYSYGDASLLWRAA